MTVANAQYNLTTQQARIVRQEANRQALQTQRATIKEMEWERKNWLQRYSPYLVRQRQMATDLRVALYDPTQEEIWSGEASLVVAKTVIGEIGFMAGHSPVLAILAEGQVRITSTDDVRVVAEAKDGFLSMENDVVTFVASNAALVS